MDKQSMEHLVTLRSSKDATPEKNDIVVQKEKLLQCSPFFSATFLQQIIQSKSNQQILTIDLEPFVLQEIGTYIKSGTCKILSTSIERIVRTITNKEVGPRPVLTIWAWADMMQVRQLGGLAEAAHVCQMYQFRDEAVTLMLMLAFMQPRAMATLVDVLLQNQGTKEMFRRVGVDVDAIICVMWTWRWVTLKNAHVIGEKGNHLSTMSWGRRCVIFPALQTRRDTLLAIFEHAGLHGGMCTMAKKELKLLEECLLAWTNCAEYPEKPSGERVTDGQNLRKMLQIHRKERRLCPFLLRGVGEGFEQTDMTKFVERVARRLVDCIDRQGLGWCTEAYKRKNCDNLNRNENLMRIWRNSPSERLTVENDLIDETGLEVAREQLGEGRRVETNKKKSD